MGTDFQQNMTISSIPLEKSVKTDFKYEQNPMINKSDITIFTFRVGERGAEAPGGIISNILYFLSLH